MLNKEILSFFNEKKILITGGTGMIGRSVAEALSQVNCEIITVSLDQLDISSKNKHIVGDLTDFNFCKDITKGIDYVFHIAGIKGSVDVTIKKPASFFVPLLMFNTNVLEASRLNSVERLVYVSSIGAYEQADVFIENNKFSGEPMDRYPGWAKRMAELQIKSYGEQYNLKNYSIVRPCNVYGPGDNFDPDNAMVIPSLMYKIFYKTQDPLEIWGDGSAIRDFAYSDDVADGIIKAMYFGTNNSYVNLGSGKGYSIKELIIKLKSFLDFNYIFMPEKSVGFSKRVMDISLAKKLIHYNPQVKLEDGLKKTWNWFVKNSEEFKKKKNYFK